MLLNAVPTHPKFERTLRLMQAEKLGRRPKPSVNRSGWPNFTERASPPFYCGGSEPRYAEIAMTSSSDRWATTGFISAAAFPALEPYCMSNSCRAI